MTAQDPSTDLENVNAAYVAMREERDRAMAEVERLREGGQQLDGVIRRLSDDVERLRGERDCALDLLGRLVGWADDGMAAAQNPDAEALSAAYALVAAAAKEDGR